MTRPKGPPLRTGAAGAATQVSWRLIAEPRHGWVAWRLSRSEAGGPYAQIGGGLLQPPAPVHRDRLSDPGEERAAAVRLGRSLIPAALRSELLGAPSPAPLHTLWLAVGGWLRGVPWDALALDDLGGVRLVERAQVLGARPDRPEQPSPRPRTIGPARGLAVIDPGPLREGADGDPIYPGGYPAVLVGSAGMPDQDWLVPDGRELTVEDFGLLLRRTGGWERLLYLGHLRPGADPSLVFRRDRRDDLLPAGRWLSQPTTWPAPARVGLLGCAGDDGMPEDSYGASTAPDPLTLAAFAAGAQLVTATRWPLPIAGRPSADDGVAQLAVAVARSHAASEPLRALNAWQRDQLDDWRATGQAAASPAYWAALATFA